MPRIPPKVSTIKKLFALSGNQCAFPSCKNRIIDSNGTVIGEICHIEAAEKGGERYNINQTDEERRSFNNLVLFCSNHHKVTNNVDKYPVTLLKQIKLNHENQFAVNGFEISESIIKSVLERYNNMGKFKNDSGSQFNNQANIQNIGTQIGTQNVNYSGESISKIEESEIQGLRKVILKFKKIIDEFRQKASPPKTAVIDFKNELIDRTERSVEIIPHIYLKFRKNNGRIKANVESYEQANGAELNEAEDSTQNLLREFLAKNDPEKKEVLKEQIRLKTQQHPAIITCDGFLINGNRRKMVLEELYQETHQDSRFENMRVVILPENVTELDICKIENRYQMQDEGKSEYSGLNRALTIRGNIEKGYSLQAQLKDDPKFANIGVKQFESEVKRIEKELLKPLELVDRYLSTFNRKKLYNTISESSGDKSGRWQAFIDYSSFYNSTLNSPNKRIQLGIKEEEVGGIDNAILKIIRKRELKSRELEKNLGKLHAFVRGGNLKKYLGNEIAKKHLLNIAKKVKEDIPNEEKFDKDNNPYSEREIDEKWSNINKHEILGNLIQAYKAVNNQTERDKPLELLEDALKKLNHENLQIRNMDVNHYAKAIDLTKKIKSKTEVIYKQLDKARFELKKLKGKNRK